MLSGSTLRRREDRRAKRVVVRSAEAFTKLTQGDVSLHRLADLGNTLAHESRIRVLMALAAGPMNRSQLISIANSDQCTVGSNLRRLRNTGLVDVGREGRFAVYRLTLRGAKLLKAAIECAS